MFQKILIANRGEIACRIIRTVQEMGLQAVAVYTDVDAHSPFVTMADEAVHIGESPANKSYLVADKILSACISTGAQAIHPGYGFLSERPDFVEAVQDRGIVFIGPPAGAIAAMGDKIASKRLAEKAGVNVVPGHADEIQTTREAIRIASDIGYPVMMKASAGGGGKGMRLARSEKDVLEGFDAIRRESLKSFGDNRVFFEKFIEHPRHIEIQILGDQHGNIIHLGERECSVQRRHQKIIEEAPSPFVDAEMREAMGAQAILLAKTVNYYSAGTVEFIVDSKKNFYFLEMNTRLQVEHPVTECVTGLNLVAQMIRIAAGEKLSLTQRDVSLKGWSVETRLYAENPYKNFLPSTGRIVSYTPPPQSRNVRVDSGVVQGSMISVHYDPMMAKLITYGEDRATAIERQVEALDQFDINGVDHNIDFLCALMRNEQFRAGDITTDFIGKSYPDGFSGASVDDSLLTNLVAIVGKITAIHQLRNASIDGQLGTSRVILTHWEVRIKNIQYKVIIEDDSILVNGKNINLHIDYIPGARLVKAIIGDTHLSIKVQKTVMGFTVNCHGFFGNVQVLPAHIAGYHVHMIENTPADLSKFLLSPMPGLLMALYVQEGDVVKEGQAIAVIEAMKMENILYARKNTIVKNILQKTGDSLAADTVILEFD